MKLPKEWSTVDKLNHLERMVLLHSLFYYEMNESLISDDEFNKIAHLLARKVQQYQGTKTLKNTMYGYVFKDYTDGSTGFDLIYKLKKKDREWLQVIADQVLRTYRKDKRL